MDEEYNALQEKDRKKYQKNIRLSDIERFMDTNKHTVDKVIEYLEYVLSENGDSEVLLRLKYSGYFVSYKRNDLFSKESKKSINKWLKSKISKNSFQKFRRYKKKESF